MSSPKISIIVPVYNVEKYIRQCVESIINQTYNNLEIILVNDGSLDSSGKLCDRYAQNDGRIKVIHKKNEGVSIARNIGIDVSTGEYILFVDGDDWIDTNTCEELARLMQQESADIVMASYAREYDAISIPKQIFDKECIVFDKQATKYKLHRRLFGIVGEELFHPENADAIVSLGMKLYKRYVIGNIRITDIKTIGTSEDALFNIFVFYNCNKIVYVNKAYYHYRKTNAMSITSAHKPDLFEKWQNLFLIMEKFINERCPEPIYYQALNNRICMSLIGLGLNEVAAKDKFLTAKAKRLKDILSTKKYIAAYAQFDVKYMPLKWKVFFVICRFRCSILLILLLMIMMKYKKIVK